MDNRKNAVRVTALGLALLLAAPGLLLAADHDDTPALKSMPRHEARITDLHVFTRMHESAGGSSRPYLVLSLCTNPTIPDTASTYLFPSDLKLEIFVDRHSDVDYTSDPAMAREFGGKILEPDAISPDIAFTITFDAAGLPSLATKGLDADTPIKLFAGMRDDPFIRGPRQGRNVAAVVLELPLQTVAPGRNKDVLVWAMSSVPGPGGSTGDLGARALRSQLAVNMPLNDYAAPSDHYRVLGMTPDVVIFDATKAASYPNGRDLTDDVVDLVGNPDILATDCPGPGDPVRCNPSSNNLAFLTTFPYLAPPQAAATGNTGVVLTYGDRDRDR